MINMEQKDRYLADIWNSYIPKEMGKQFVLFFKMYFYNNILKWIILF